PIAAPSANRFGHTSHTTAAHVMDDLAGRIDMFFDGGATSVGVESTVLDVTCTPPMILRPGGVSREAIEKVIGRVELRDNRPNLAEEAQASPGLLGKHYTPKAELVLCKGERVSALEKLSELAKQARAEGRSVGLLLANEDIQSFASLSCISYPLGSANNFEAIARNLYAGMRGLDDKNVSLILTRDFGEQGLGLAIHDRLLRAASQII
ncbi:MAG: Sua5/YciO/YrdC/YwlC family protein, partial [Chloroflexi bacterium]|nr:Sua5/YciO/YrdC/YwlC family protein [Chloroflexota bacterium]